MVKLAVLAAVLAVVVLSASGESLPRERDRESHRESPRERESVRIRREPPSRHHYGPPQPQSSFGSPPKYTKGYRGTSKPHYGPPPSGHLHNGGPSNSRYGPPHKPRGPSYKSGSSKNPGRHTPPDSFSASQTYGRPIRASAVGPTKSSYGPPRGYGPSKPHHSHSGKGSYSVPSKSSYHHKSKYSSHPKPLKYPSSSKYSYPPNKSQPNSEFTFKPSTPFGTSTEYKPPTEYKTSFDYKPSSSSSSSYDSTKLYNSYGESPQSGNYGSTWYTSPSYGSGSSSSSSSSSSESDPNSYDTSSLYPSSSKTKPEQTTYTEIQPSISYTLPVSFDSDSSKSSSTTYHRGSSRPLTSSASYKTSTTGNSYQSPIAHGGAATSYVSVTHDDSGVPAKLASNYGTQAVVTTSYRAPSSTYSHSLNPSYSSDYKTSASSKTPHVYTGSLKTSSPSTSYSSHDIQTAASNSHETEVTQNQFKPTNNFSFLPYKQQATSQVKDASVGLSPDEWESYYGSPSTSFQDASTQVETLSPSYYDPVAAPLSEKSTTSSTSRKKDIARVHQKMLQQSSSQSQSASYSKPAYGFDTDSASSDVRSR